MRRTSLIVIANLIALLAGCVAPAPPPSQVVNRAPVATAPNSTEAAFAPGGSGAYLTGQTLDLYRLLPPPPEAGSAQERGELDTLLQIQAARSPAAAQFARDDSRVSIFRFTDVFGNPAKFDPTDLPLTAALFGRIAKDEALFLDTAKDRFGRPRPFVTEKRIQAVAAKPPTPSYPSGHTTWAIASAIVLADMVPERRDQIFARAEAYAYNREVAGVHYPSDVAAGHLAGTVLAAMLLQSPRFRADEAAAAAELRAALGLPPHPLSQH
jgi:acid phosphatase (class A)